MIIMHSLHTDSDVSDGSSLPAWEIDHADQSHTNDLAVSHGHECVSCIPQEGNGTGMFVRAWTAFKDLVNL